jgi:PhnB protein
MDAEDGERLLHCHLRINGADLTMPEEFPEHGGPQGVTLHLAVDDADAWCERALAAGTTVKMPLADQFWGDRYGKLQDPFGHSWSIGAPIRT